MENFVSDRAAEADEPSSMKTGIAGKGQNSAARQRKNTTLTCASSQQEGRKRIHLDSGY